MSNMQGDTVDEACSSSFRKLGAENVKQHNAVEKWGHLSCILLKKGYWSRLGNLTKELKTLPNSVAVIYDEIESRSPIKLNAEMRLIYYREFTRAALGATTLHYREVEALILRKNPEIATDRFYVLNLMTSKVHEMSKGNIDQCEYLDFQHFATLLYYLLKCHADTKKPNTKEWKVKELLQKLPFDPDSGKKQIWDVICLILLLYCSFAVPFSIAFDDIDTDQDTTIKEKVEVFMDAIFMLDIFLNFITGWDNQGIIVREFSLIAKNYFRTWFIPDLAGSFPFDKVITAFIDTDQNNLSSTNMIRGLRLIRMLKLIRALKFMNKLEKLKQTEEFEAFGTLITLISAAFTLLFTAHVLGCFYTILIAYEDGDNWLLSYSPDLVTADVPTRYVVSLYWAMVTISTMGYGDILPVTHAERIFAILVAIIGAVVFSYCMGTVSSLISKVAGVDVRFEEKMRGVVEYMQYREFSDELKRKVRSYFNICWRRSSAPFNEQGILADMDRPLRARILRHVGTQSRADLPILQGFDDRCLGFVVTYLRPTTFDMGEIIYERGERCDEMYFLVEGVVALHTIPLCMENGNEPSQQGQPQQRPWEGGDCSGGGQQQTSQLAGEQIAAKGDIFGEGCLLPDAAGLHRRERASAVSTVLAYALKADALQEIAEEYPEAAARLREFAMVRAMAMEMQTASHDCAMEAAAAEAARAVRCGESGNPCKLQMRISQAKSNLIRQREVDLLVPAAGPGASDVLHLLRPATALPVQPVSSTISSPIPSSCELGVSATSSFFRAKSTQVDRRSVEMLEGISCAIGAGGEVLYLDHSVKSLALGGPWRLGTLCRNSSMWRTLSEADTAFWGGSSMRRLYGCVITLVTEHTLTLPPPQAPPGSSSLAEMRGPDNLFRQVLLTWSQDDFDDLCETLTDRLGEPSGTLIPAFHQKQTTGLAQEEESSNHLPGARSESGAKSNTTGLSTIHASTHCEISCNKALGPAPAKEFQPAKLEAAKLHIDNAMVATNASSLASSDLEASELIQIAEELQTLAETTGRLRRGLDQLLALPASSLAIDCPNSDQVVEDLICPLTGTQEIYQGDRGLHENLLRSVKTLQMAEVAMTEEKVKLSSSLGILFERTGAIFNRYVASDGAANVRKLADSRLQARVGKEPKAVDVGLSTLWVQERLLLTVETLLAKLQPGHVISQSPAMLPVAINYLNRQKAQASQDAQSNAASSALSIASATHADAMKLATSFSKSESGSVNVGQEDSKEPAAVTGMAVSVALKRNHCRSNDQGQVHGGEGGHRADGINKFQGSEMGGAVSTASPIGSVAVGGCKGTAPDNIHWHPLTVSPAAAQQAFTNFEGLVSSHPACQPAVTPGSLPSLTSTLQGYPPSPPGHWEDIAGPRLRNGTDVLRTPQIHLEACRLASPCLRSCSETVVGGQAEAVAMLLQAPLSAPTMTLPAHKAGVAVSPFARPMETAVDMTRYYV